jgi:hypothetical protein
MHALLTLGDQSVCRAGTQRIGSPSWCEASPRLYRESAKCERSLPVDATVPIATQPYQQR